jgi:anti-sigma-K factor RskA
MSDRNHQEGSEACGADVAAYALGALEPEEAEAFARHLQLCSVCREELAEFQAVVDVLPMSIPLHRPPGALRGRVMSAIYADLPAPSAERSRRPRFSWPLTRNRALALGTALAVLVVGVVAGLELGSSSGPASRVYAAQVTGPGSAHVTVLGGRAELSVQHMNAPPAGEIYEVWLARPNHPPAPTTALFSVTARGNADVDVPGNLRDVRQIMVTPEPSGGTRVPTNPPVIRAQLS